MEHTVAVGASLPQILPPALGQAPGRTANPQAVGKAFEEMFASIIIKQMRQTVEGGMFSGDSGDVLGGLFDHFLGEHIAKAGGFGVGNMIRSQLERRAGRMSST